MSRAKPEMRESIVMLATIVPWAVTFCRAGSGSVDIPIPRRHISAPSISGRSGRSDHVQEAPLANSAQARKRARQAEKHRRQNASHRSMVRTYIKRVQAAIEGGDFEAANTALKTAIPVIDNMAGKGILHRNKAARHKSRLNAQVLALKS